MKRKYSEFLGTVGAYMDLRVTAAKAVLGSVMGKELAKCRVKGKDNLDPLDIHWKRIFYFSITSRERQWQNLYLRSVCALSTMTIHVKIIWVLTWMTE